MRIFELENSSIQLYDVKDQLKRHVYEKSLKAFATGDQDRDNVTLSNLERRRKMIREQFIHSIGGLPSSDNALNARITGTIQRKDYCIEKIIFESRPHTYVTGSFYKPSYLEAPCPAVLLLCGHSDNGRLYEDYQRVCQYLVQAGISVLAIDPVGQGERASYYEPQIDRDLIYRGITEHDYAGAQCWPLGKSIARYFVHDAIRAIDYLCSRNDVNSTKIGITGSSGGGTQSSMVMLCDDRLAAAAPANFIMNRETYMHAGQAQDAEQIWLGMTALGFDHEDILLAMAPKPVVVLAVRYDFFPIEGSRRTVERCRRYWELLDAGEKLQIIEEDNTHDYTDYLAKEATFFFAKHLAGREINTEELAFERLEDQKLWSTTTGQVRGDYENARAVYEENVDFASKLRAMREGLPIEHRKQAARTWLERKVITPRTTCSLNERYEAIWQLEELTVQRCLWWSQPGLMGHAFIFRNALRVNQLLPVSIGLWSGGTQNLKTHLHWIRKQCAAGRLVMVLDVSGEGGLEPNRINPGHLRAVYGTFHKLTSDLMWLDDSMAALRCYDVIRAVEWISSTKTADPEQIELYVDREFALYGLVAKFLDNHNRINHLYVENGVEMVEDWVTSRFYDIHDRMSVILPGMLQLFDLSDLQQWTGTEIINGF